MHVDDCIEEALRRQDMVCLDHFILHGKGKWGQLDNIQQLCSVAVQHRNLAFYRVLQRHRPPVRQYDRFCDASGKGGFDVSTDKECRRGAIQGASLTGDIVYFSKTVTNAGRVFDAHTKRCEWKSIIRNIVTGFDTDNHVDMCLDLFVRSCVSDHEFIKDSMSAYVCKVAMGCGKYKMAFEYCDDRILPVRKVTHKRAKSWLHAAQNPLIDDEEKEIRKKRVRRFAHKAIRELCDKIRAGEEERVLRSVRGRYTCRYTFLLELVDEIKLSPTDTDVINRVRKLVWEKREAEHEDYTRRMRELAETQKKYAYMWNNCDDELNFN
jgi:hypothetical protein